MMLRFTKLVFFCLGLLHMVGCADLVKDARVAEYTASQTTLAGYKALNDADHSKIDQIEGEAKAGNVDQAQADLQAYVPQRAKALQALDAASDLLKTVDDAVSAVKAGAKDPKDLASYLPQLAAAAASVKDALSVLGVKL